MTDLTQRLSDATEGTRELDVLIEVALFEPDEEFVSCRANNAGTWGLLSLTWLAAVIHRCIQLNERKS